MNVFPALVFALISAIAIFTSGALVSRSGRPINMRTYRIGNVIIPLLFFFLALFLTR